jgi:hypothetical protein
MFLGSGNGQARVKGDSEIITFNRLVHANGWKREGQSRIVVHGERGVGVNEPGLASTAESYAISTNCATLASLIQSPS